MSHNQPDAVAVVPLSWVKSECTGAYDCDLAEPANVFAPGVPSLEACSLKRSLTFESSTTSHSVILSSSSVPTESAQSISSDIEVREAISHEDASSCAPLTPRANADGDASSASSIPSPPLEEGLWMTLDEVDRSTGNVNLDVAFSEQNLDQNGLPMRRSTWTHGSKGEDLSLSQLDELLQMDIQEFDGLLPACAEDLCPSVLSQDFPMPESVTTMPLEPPPHCISECASKETVRNAEEPVEDVSKMFARWVRDNAHLFSLSDLKHIKLKTSTIEDATRRLGGGKKGMLYFVKLILMWLQNHHLKQRDGGASQPTKLPSAGFVNEQVGATSRIGNGTAGVSGTCTFLANGDFRDERGLSDSASRSERLHGAFARPGAVNCPQFPKHEGVQRMLVRVNGVHDSVASSYNNQSSPPPVFRENEWNLSHSVNSAVENGCATSWFGSGPSVEDRNLQPFPATGVVATGGLCAPVCDSLAPTPNTPAAATRAARKNRMERQRWSLRHYRKRPSFSSSNFAWAYQASGAMQHDLNYSLGSCQRLARSSLENQQGRKAEINLKLLFQKELKQSDVGNLGRIVVPKAAETSLPQLDLKDGVNLIVEDMDSFKVWNMRYRFWPNNKSRMYLLENTGDFVKSHNLKEGDFMMFYSNNLTNNYLIRGAKGERSETTYAVPEKNCFNSSTRNDRGVENPVRSEGKVGGNNNSDLSNGCLALKESSMDIVTSESPCDRESSNIDDCLFAKLIEQSLDDDNDP